MGQSIKPSIERLLAKKIYLSLLLLSLTTALILTWLTLAKFEQILSPQVLSKSSVIGSSVRTTVEDAVKFGIPFDSLVGMNDYLAETLKENPEIAYISVQRDGSTSYTLSRSDRADRDSAKVIDVTLEATHTAPRVIVGVRAAYIQEKLYIMFGDAAVVSLVALILGLEIALFFAARWILRPIDTWRAMIQGLQAGQTQKDIKKKEYGPFAELVRLSNDKIAVLRGQLGFNHRIKVMTQEWYEPKARDVRGALFLFVFSEELLRSFLPLYIKTMVGASSPLHMQVAISAPIMGYMLMAGIGTLFGSGLIERMGLHRAFGLSVLISTLSLIGLAFSHTLTEIIIWRCIAALGYAFATIACQVYIARTASNSDANLKGLSIFVAAVTAACICGAPIGAVVADIFGQSIALLFAATICLLSWFFFRGVSLPNVADNVTSKPAGVPATAGFGALFKNKRIQLAMWCGVMPGKLMMAGMLFYITPLLLQQYQLSQASIGQFFILYYALLSAGNVVISRMKLDLQAKVRLVVVGGFLSGAGALVMYWFDSPIALALAIISFGLGQSLLITPVTAVILNIVQTEIPSLQSSRALALSRAVERVGGILGAALAAVFSAYMGYREASVLLGVLVIFLGLGTIPLLWAPAKRVSKA
jgi:predicted MFS family arabinose efflux permease/HAMP domain-containing protein